jgi:Cu/Ag efflux protein CusF
LAVVFSLLASLAHAEVIELEGTVKAVDASSRSITIERKTAKGTKTLALQVTKKAGDLSSVKVGDSISFGYDPELEVVTKIDAGRQQANRGAAAGDDADARPFLDKILNAIEDNDYETYVADFTGSFKAQTTKQIVARISEQLSPRMKKGYDVLFLTDLKQSGQKAYLWKMTFEDGGDDWSVKVWLKDGKVSGFLLQ